MNKRVLRVSSLLFFSGLCALVYQNAWLRELRLIFGASTAASAAVLAIFMGGLGAGGLLLGRRVDRHPRPLLLYAQLELGISVSAALTPALLSLVRAIYISMGGSTTLGLPVSTAVRLVLSALVLAVPTLLMGGTLPAAARAAWIDADARRRSLATLYALNTLGAVTGTALSTFALIEALGARRTLWLACGINVAIALVARAMALRLPANSTAAPAPEAAPGPVAQAAQDLPPSSLILAAAAGVGFAFFLMELVFYRMLAPLLGGSSFTFGLILAVALFGIGTGSVAYTWWGGTRRPSLGDFALSCILEAAFLALPFALGDRIAVLALLLRSLGTVGFAGLAIGWTVVAALVVLPAAFIAGLQFPLLCALLGQDEEDTGRKVGLAYAWNTAGAILGSLAGGFGLLPLLTAPGAWRFSAGLLVALGLGAAALSLRGPQRPGRSWRRWPLLPLALAGATLLLLSAQGPTAAWRHSGIGFGRADQPASTLNILRDWAHKCRRYIAWEVDGTESSVAVSQETGLAFVVGGGIDGNARGDAQTQIMSGLLGTLLHPAPRSVFVVGLGTGSTAGWVGAVPSIDRVDVVELEPAILRVARDCAAVNQRVLENPKVHVLIGDGREVLLTAKRRYDVIMSEPSNPYRAGIASLFTREFYQAIAGRLTEGGILVQWIQGYSVDSQTIRMAYATMAGVFPHIETWEMTEGDLLLVASQVPVRYDAAALRARILEEPYRTALAQVLRTTDLEGLLSHFIARSSLAHAIAGLQGDQINTDDRNPMEFGFARLEGRRGLFDMSELWLVARARGEDRPEISGAVDWDRVYEGRISMRVANGAMPELEPGYSERWAMHVQAHRLHIEGRMAEALEVFRRIGGPPRDPIELALVTEGLAEAGDEAALVPLAELRGSNPVVADAILGRLRFRQGKFQEAAAALDAAFVLYRQRPWALRRTMLEALRLAAAIGRRDRDAGMRLYQTLRVPFSVGLLTDARLTALMELAEAVDYANLCSEVMGYFEPHVPWRRGFLTERLRCYEMASSHRVARARQDLADFEAEESQPFGDGLMHAPQR